MYSLLMSAVVAATLFETFADVSSCCKPASSCCKPIFGFAASRHPPTARAAQAPLILDAMLSGNFSGTNPKAATPAHQTNAELVRLQLARMRRHLPCGYSNILCKVA